MEKIIILALLLCLVGCDKKGDDIMVYDTNVIDGNNVAADVNFTFIGDATDLTFDANTDLVWFTDIESATFTDFSFSGREGSEVLFNWRDGKFDVTYDANECTQSAQTFIDCMLPFLNETIKTAAKELIEKEKKNGR